MEGTLHFHKVIHLLIDQFVTEFETYIELKEVDRQKVYIEVLKRSSSISLEIAAIASTFLASLKTAAVPITEEAILKKISHLVESSLQQDLVECALISRDEMKDDHFSKDSLHNALYKCCISGKLTAIPSLMNLCLGTSDNEDASFSYFQHSFTKNHCAADPSGPISSEFESSCNVLEKEVGELRHSLGTRVSSVELKLHDLSSANKDSYSGPRRSISLQEKISSAHVGNWLHSAMSWDGDSCKEQTNEAGLLFSGNDPILSWENRVKQSIPCHLYTSELTGKEVQWNIIEEDPHVFRSLFDSANVVSEYDFIHDILDLLVGIPSSTFIYNKIQKKFQLKSQSRLHNLSHESTLKFSESFVDSGTMFHRLKLFCSELISSAEGFVLKGLKEGVKEILTTYTEYIASVKMNSPTMLVLRRDISDNADLIMSLGAICKLSASGSDVTFLPTGLGLLSYLNKLSLSYKCRETGIMVAVLLKFAYSPYLEFLNKWMTTGICCDPYNEFHILEDVRYLERKDELYWKFAYTNVKDDASRTVPLELEKYSHDILQCGKSMRLLQNGCPQLPSLEFMTCNPPPCFSMLFSYHATNSKKSECASYILWKEASEKDSSESLLSEMDLLIEKQQTVERKFIISRIQRRWNQSKKVSKISNESSSNIFGWNKDPIPKRCKSFPDFSPLPDATTFSGAIHKTAGILFESSFKDVSALNSIGQTESCPSLYTSKDCQRREVKKCLPIPNAGRSEDKKTEMHSSNKNLHLCSFLNSLASFLLSDYNDTNEDVCSCLQLSSFQNLMQYNFSAVMSMRMHLVQKTIVDYIINELKLKDLLSCLKNTYFLQDECFSQSLGKRLFNWAMKCESLDEFANWSKLNEMLTSSVAVPSLVDVPFLESASVNFVALPEEYVSKRNKFMQYFHFEFNIDFPLNIIITTDCIHHYSRIFSFIMEMEFLCWLLAKIWRRLLISGKENKLENSPQFRKLMLNRFDMHQFIRVLRNCIHQDIGGPLWAHLEKALGTGEIGMDALQSMHGQYLDRALARCFLTTETAHLHDVLDFLFQQVEKFCRAALVCTWKLNTGTGYFESSEFEHLSDSFTKYQKLKGSFYERTMKMVRRKTLQRIYDEHYQMYLETVLETSRKMY